MLAAVIVIVFIGVIGGMGFMVYKALQKSDPKSYDSSASGQIETAQEFLPFEDIKDGMVSLGGHRYRAYLECSSINFQLKTAKEREAIELSFKRFLNSLQRPIVFYLQTRKLDTTKMMKLLQTEIQESVERYPQLQNYGDKYFHEMGNLSEHIGNNKQKKKYIIVSYDVEGELGNLSDKEKYEYAAKEIHNQLVMIQDGLTSFGIQGKLMDTRDIAELVFSTYHKENHGHVENIVNGEFLTILVEEENNIMENLDEDAHLDWILFEAESRIQQELAKESLDQQFEKHLEETLDTLNALREKVAGYYIQREEGTHKKNNEKPTEKRKFSFNE